MQTKSSVRMLKSSVSGVSSKPEATPKETAAKTPVSSVPPVDSESEEPRDIVVKDKLLGSMGSQEDEQMMVYDDDEDDWHLERTPGKKSLVKTIACFSVLAVMILVGIIGGMYLLINKSTTPEEDTVVEPEWFKAEEADTKGLVTVTSRCRKAFPEHRYCVTESNKIDKCTGVKQCQIVTWKAEDLDSHILSITGPDKDSLYDLHDTERVHCGRGRWCQNKSCTHMASENIQRHMSKPYTHRMVEYEPGQWVPADQDMRCSETLKEKLRQPPFKEMLRQCSQHVCESRLVPNKVQLKIRRCDLVPGAMSGKRKQPCEGMPLGAVRCGRCENFAPTDTESSYVCNPDEEGGEQPQGLDAVSCVYVCNSGDKKKPNGVECGVGKDPNVTGVCIEGLCIPLID